MTIYEDDAPHVVGSVVTLFVLAIMTFGLRVYVRVGKTWGPEDTSMAIAVVSTIPLSSKGRRKKPEICKQTIF